MLDMNDTVLFAKPVATFPSTDRDGTKTVNAKTYNKIKYCLKTVSLDETMSPRLPILGSQMVSNLFFLQKLKYEYVTSSAIKVMR